MRHVRKALSRIALLAHAPGRRAIPVVGVEAVGSGKAKHHHTTIGTLEMDRGGILRNPWHALPGAFHHTVPTKRKMVARSFPVIPPLGAGNRVGKPLSPIVLLGDV